ncbi:MAG: hypothetical protein CMJ64_06695 [Planctomycetaceae bacterium]|nr:hypothetical protein [Planctomycetaceae bacterium]
MAASPRQLGTAALVALVALRIGIGFHFFKEGADKLQNPKWTSAGFLGNANGPFASSFRSMVWDADGLARLDSEQTIAMWDHFRERVAARHDFNEEQAKQATTIFERRKNQLKMHLEDMSSDVREYQLGLVRRDKYRAERGRAQVASLAGQIDRIEGELRSKRAELLGPIDLMWSGYEAELNSLAASEQRRGRTVALSRPGRSGLDSEAIDGIIPCFDLTLGLLLIIGLFTRSAAIVAGLFLCSVIASQWPGTQSAISTWPQITEALGLFVIAATATGRLAGADFFVSLLRGWCCKPKQGTNS